MFAFWCEQGCIGSGDGFVVCFCSIKNAKWKADWTKKEKKWKTIQPNGYETICKICWKKCEEYNTSLEKTDCVNVNAFFGLGVGSKQGSSWDIK